MATEHTTLLKSVALTTHITESLPSASLILDRSTPPVKILLRLLWWSQLHLRRHSPSIRKPYKNRFCSSFFALCRF